MTIATAFGQFSSSTDMDTIPSGKIVNVSTNISPKLQLDNEYFEMQNQLMYQQYLQNDSLLNTITNIYESIEEYNITSQNLLTLNKLGYSNERINEILSQWTKTKYKLNMIHFVAIALIAWFILLNLMLDKHINLQRLLAFIIVMLPIWGGTLLLYTILNPQYKEFKLLINALL